MSGQMCWLSSSNYQGQLILHLRERSFEPWLPYTVCPQHKVPDYLIPGGSKGWSTYQKLRQAGWTLIPTAQAQNAVIRPEVQRV
ncbi:hypothetical protein [Leptolyngbya sp. FACHB-17]|uniref:hypothetical protein n=1 Tax=unclassified Leptolyngbya TaxID=2650499 RepID=UPI0016819150|nr:hypothetical protein [Leptolyngbya sp. FACHB-17]MBD2080419.1 hypothetical protein [Leptolyngbya sp. FACHB-17]